MTSDNQKLIFFPSKYLTANFFKMHLRTVLSWICDQPDCASRSITQWHSIPHTKAGPVYCSYVRNWNATLCYHILDSSDHRKTFIQGSISWSILSVIFTDKFAFSQSDARISVAFSIVSENHSWNGLLICYTNIFQSPKAHSFNQSLSRIDIFVLYPSFRNFISH